MQDQKTFEVTMSQDHYVKALRPITADSVQLAKEDDEVEDDLKQQFWSLLGGVAWIVVVRGDIVVYLGYLQRAAKRPQVIAESSKTTPKYMQTAAK